MLEEANQTKKSYSAVPVQIDFGTCNVLKPLLEDRENFELYQGGVGSTANKASNLEVTKYYLRYGLYILNHVLLENTVGLRESQYIFLRQLFGCARVGAVFLIIDSSENLFPEILTVAATALSTGTNTHIYFRVCFPRTSTCRNVLCLVKCSRLNVGLNASRKVTVRDSNGFYRRQVLEFQSLECNKANEARHKEFIQDAYKHFGKYFTQEMRSTKKNQNKSSSLRVASVTQNGISSTVSNKIIYVFQFAVHLCLAAK